MGKLSIKNITNLFGNLTYWNKLKKWVFENGKTVACDKIFEFSFKYSVFQLVIMIALSCANQFVRDIDISCDANDASSSSSYSSSNWGSSSGGTSVSSNLNDFCWNHETFLAEKALHPSMRGQVTYPGVSQYLDDRDTAIRQRYYKLVWFILALCVVFSLIPYFALRMAAFRQKIESFAYPRDAFFDIGDENDQAEVRVGFFIAALGFNNSFACKYLLFKLFSIISPFAQAFILVGFIGPRYLTYGLDVVIYLTSFDDPWPHPMDVLFPKMAKCLYRKFGLGGDPETQSAQCQLPMNNINQWMFFVYWWWLVILMALNLFSLLTIMKSLIPYFRNRKWKTYSADIVTSTLRHPDNLQELFGPRFSICTNVKKYIKCEGISFGDHLTLSFMKMNMLDWEFRKFFRLLLITKNPMIYICSNEQSNKRYSNPYENDENEQFINNLSAGNLVPSAYPLHRIDIEKNSNDGKESIFKFLQNAIIFQEPFILREPRKFVYKRPEKKKQEPKTSTTTSNNNNNGWNDNNGTTTVVTEDWNY